MRVAKHAYLLSSLIALNTFDAIATLWTVRICAYWDYAESNPVLAAAMSVSPWAFVVVKTLLVLVPVYIFARALRSSSSRARSLAKIGLALATVAYLALFAFHLSIYAEVPQLLPPCMKTKGFSCLTFEDP